MFRTKKIMPKAAEFTRQSSRYAIPFKKAILNEGCQYFFLGNSYKCLVLPPSESHVQISDMLCGARLC
jgi:hypothetical protein